MFISITFSFVLYGISSRELNFGLRRQTRAFQEIPPPNGSFPNSSFDLSPVAALRL